MMLALALALALCALWARTVRVARRAARRDPYACLGALPATWHPSSRTVVVAVMRGPSGYQRTSIT